MEDIEVKFNWGIIGKRIIKTQIIKIKTCENYKECISKAYQLFWTNKPKGTKIIDCYIREPEDSCFQGFYLNDFI